MRKRTLRPGEVSKTTDKLLLKLASDLQKGIPPLSKLRWVDDMVGGLTFHIFDDGEIGIHISYTIGGDSKRRPFMKLGTLAGSSTKAAREQRTDEKFTLAEARELAKAIKAIGDRGIDVEKDARQRLIAEIKRDGGRWSPTPNAPARK
jgi:hypothetical protein